jgi:hypothetical protein
MRQGKDMMADKPGATASLLRDGVDRTETAMSQAHCFELGELGPAAQAAATPSSADAAGARRRPGPVCDSPVHAGRTIAH